MKNLFFGVVLTIFVGSVGVSGQVAFPRRAPVLKTGVETYVADNFVVGDVKASVQSKAVYIAKPEYPNEARWAGAEGEVRVQIAIDSDGNVSKTEVLSGDPLLIAASTDAARRTKFRIARDASGQAVEDGGILVYTFEIKKANWSAVAYGLSGLDRLPIWTFSIPTAMKALEPDWTRERNLLAKLDEIRRAASPPQRPAVVTRSAQTTTTTRLPNGTISRSSNISGQLVVPQEPTAEQKSLALDLQTALGIRLSNDELSQWQFNLGLGLRETAEQIRNPNVSSTAAPIIQKFIDTAPVSASPQVLTALSDLEANYRNGKRNPDLLNETARLYTIILGSK
ncbi:MAG: energy transducer TonB [Pyrinomonadaceae bacterium]